MAAMIARTLRSLFKGPAPAPAPCVPEGVVAYAIGDVHGRDDLLEPLVAHILANPGFAEAQRRVVIGLGDYIDRGPASRQVIGRLVGLKATPGVEARLLRGNHDQTLLDFLADAGAGPAWCEFGGAEAMRSYGVNPPSARADLEDWDTARQALAEAMPPAHLSLLRGLEPCLELGSYFFAHAGARPGVPLDQQDEQDLMWIRQPFLGDPRPFERVVVHGHSASVEAFADRRRIGIDTGAYATGVLTALRLQGDDRRLVQATRQRDKTVRIEQTPV
jgi:serine/threonine protein phosphatase 1